MTTPSPEHLPGARKRKWLVIGVITVVVLAVGITLGVTATMTETDSRSGPASPSPSDPAGSSSPTASPTAESSTAPTPDAEFGEPVAEVVGPDEEGSFGNGASVQIAGITSFESGASGVGEVSGAGARIELELRNGATEVLDLAGVTVNAYYGYDRVPASPIASDTDASAFSGRAAAGESVTGSYSFSVPESDIPSLVVTVSSGAGVPIVVFDPR